MMFKKLAIGAAVALSFGAAQAGTIQIGGDAGGVNGKMTTKSGVCTLTFDGTSCAGVVESGNTAGNVVQGSVSGQYAAPAGDTSHYLTVGPSAGSPITFTMMLPANYFGFFAGSLDSYNLVQFFNAAGSLVDSFTGTQINAVAFPGQGTTGNQAEAQFIDYFPTSTYTRVVISSSANAFELDNLAIGVASPTTVPEPGSVALIGLGVVALVASRRRRKA